jgi:hypothetical protein
MLEKCPYLTGGVCSHIQEQHPEANPTCSTDDLKDFAELRPPGFSSDQKAGMFFLASLSFEGRALANRAENSCCPAVSIHARRNRLQKSVS